MLQKTQRFIPGLSQLAVYCCKKNKTTEWVEKIYFRPRTLAKYFKCVRAFWLIRCFNKSQLPLVYDRLKACPHTWRTYPYRTSYRCLFSVQALVFGFYLSAVFAGTSAIGIFNKLLKSLEEQFKWKKNFVKRLFKVCFTYGTWLPDVEDLSRKKVFSFRPKEDELFSLTRYFTWNCGKRLAFYFVKQDTQISC